MKKSVSGNIITQLVFLSLVVFLSRLPFLWAGFGAEEDAWLLPLTAKNIALKGTYEMSRAPGHPLQEFLYAFLYKDGLNSFATNLLSALSSVIATVFFALALRQLGHKHYLFASFAFAFTPIIYISSTYTIDYMIAMACVMGSFYFITKSAFSESCSYPTLTNISQEQSAGLFPLWRREIGWGGVFLGIAIGFRLTSAAMLLPFCILIFSRGKSGLMRICILAFSAISIGLLTYLPVIKTYGTSFFTYSDQFPYPNLPKVFYKLTVGVFGSIGIIAIIYFKINVLLKKRTWKENLIPSEMPAKLFWVCISVILLYFISYLRLPQKSAYFIPAVPFIILMFGYYLSSRAFKTFCILLILSSFFLSVNLTDPLRGSTHSPLSLRFTLAGQGIFMDPLTGPVFSDYTKRLNKIAFTEQVYQKTLSEKRKIILICGWWYNQLLVRSWDCKQNENVLPVFYIDKPTMEQYLSKGYTIYYLPEQNIYNDQFSKMNCTDSLSKPYF